MTTPLATRVTAASAATVFLGIGPCLVTDGLANQVAHEIWVCANQAVTRWEGDIMDFKEHLRRKAGLSD
nr:unnamed protein product [Digitaria exilis]